MESTWLFWQTRIYSFIPQYGGKGTFERVIGFLCENSEGALIFKDKKTICRLWLAPRDRKQRNYL